MVCVLIKFIQLNDMFIVSHKDLTFSNGALLCFQWRVNLHRRNKKAPKQIKETKPKTNSKENKIRKKLTRNLHYKFVLLSYLLTHAPGVNTIHISVVFFLFAGTERRVKDIMAFVFN
jgi:hypothetical protein